jgi:hypothetical protein
MKLPRSSITQEYVKNRLAYNAETGILTWLPQPESAFARSQSYLTWHKRFCGKEAGTAILDNGYKYINIANNVLLVHRVIWLHQYGYWPEQVDHINHDRTDNRLANLIEVNVGENARNISLPDDNTSGRIGVSWVSHRGTWRATIKAHGVSHHLGTYHNKVDAVAARERAEKEFGFHENHGVPANDNESFDDREVMGMVR